MFETALNNPMGWVPTSNKVTLAWDSNPNTQTAPANGWFYLAFIANTSQQVVQVSVSDANNNGTYAYVTWTPAAQGGAFIVPVAKGDKCVFSAGSGQLQAVTEFSFIYAEGEL